MPPKTNKVGSKPSIRTLFSSACGTGRTLLLEARILEGDVDQIENQNEEEVEEDEGDVIESDGDGDGIDNE